MQKSKYLVVNEHDKLWGLTVSTVGYDEISPGEDYPTKGHADGYYFDIKRGRVLNEFQLLYVPEGEGFFESYHHPLTRLRTGDMFMLFPGEWHNYYPNSEVGWKSYWIGFKGKNVDDRVRAGFFSVNQPIHHVGFSEQIVSLYEEALNAAMEEEAYSQQVLAGVVNHMVGKMYALERNIQLNMNRGHVEMINKARLRIRETLEKGVTIQQIAENMGVSYSNFRKLFKEYTGISPALYQQDLKLQRAKELLSTTGMSIKNIAYQLNFDSPDYFSSKFRNKTGVSPSNYRNLMK